MREKVGKSRNTVFFQWFGAPEGRKVGSLKRRVRSQLARWEMTNFTPLWREAHFQVKMRKAPQLRSTFRSCDVEKVHAIVARSTFPSQNVQNTPLSDHFWKLRCRKSARRCGAKHISKSKCTTHTRFGHFWKLRCRKSARRCGAKHISKSKCTKHTRFGPLLEVEMSKKCTPLWREAHFQVKMYKTHQVRTTFGSWDVEKVHAVVARSTFPSQNVQNTTCSRHFWRFGCRFASLHYTTLHYTTLHYTPLHYATLHCTTFHYTSLHYTTLYYTTTTTTTTQLHSTTIHSTTLHYINYTTLPYITLHYTPLHYTTLHYTTFHYTSLHYTTLHSTTLQLRLHNYTPLHEITLHYTTLHYTTLHSTTLHYTTLHYNTLNDTAPQIDR